VAADYRRKKAKCVAALRRNSRSLIARAATNRRTFLRIPKMKKGDSIVDKEDNDATPRFSLRGEASSHGRESKPLSEHWPFEKEEHEGEPSPKVRVLQTGSRAQKLMGERQRKKK